MKKKIKLINILIIFLILITILDNGCYAKFSIDTSNIKKADDNTNTNTNTSSNTNTTTDISVLQQQQTQIQTQINEENKNLEQIQNQLTEQLEAIQELDQKIEESEEEISKTNMKIYRYETKIAEAQSVIDDIQNEYDQKCEDLDNRLVEVYMQGNFTYVEVLLNSKNPLDFAMKYYYAKQIAQSDNELLESVKQNKQQIVEYKQELEEVQNELGEIKKAYIKTEKIVENTKVKRQILVNELSAQEKQVQNVLDSYNTEFSKINAQILEYAKGQIDTTYIGGTLAWPVPGYTRITSEYGMRLHPITKVYKLHTGCDIGAPLGADFVAANDGVVVTAKYNSAYGNMVIIDHGGGITTLYAHGSEILVKEGDYVTRNTPVLKVGSTRYSTRPHAHFEVRLDGVVTDPMPYITNGDIPSVETT